MSQRVPRTPVLPPDSEKALAFQSCTPVAIPRHKATTGANVSSAALATPLKEKLILCATVRLPGAEKAHPFGRVASPHGATTSVNDLSALFVTPFKAEAIPCLSVLQKLPPSVPFSAPATPTKDDGHEGLIVIPPLDGHPLLLKLSLCFSLGRHVVGGMLEDMYHSG